MSAYDWWRRLYGLAALLMLCLIAGAAQAAPKKLAVLILSGQNNHDWKTTTPALKSILESTGRFIVDVTDHPDQSTAQSLARYDVLLSNWNTFGDPAAKEWPETARQAVLQFVRSGKGYVVIHAGRSSFYDWGDYQEISIATWQNGVTGHGPRHRFLVQIAAPDHPITHGLRFFVTSDELWHRAGVQPGAIPLATAYSAADAGGSGRDEPIALAQPFGRGRSFCLLLGHDTEAMSSPGFRALLQRGTEWAATGHVTIPAPPAALNDTELAWLLDQIRAYRPGQRRDALWMLEYHVAQVAGTPRARATATALAKLASDTGAGYDARQTAIRQLALIGGEREVKTLSGLLSDRSLGAEALAALERIPGPASMAALRSALKRATGRQRIGLIDALGARRDPLAVPLIARAAGDGDSDVVAAAYKALGEVGTPEALRQLLLRERAVPAPAGAAYLGALLRCADHLIASGRADTAGTAYRKLAVRTMPSPIRAAATSGLIAIAKTSDRQAALMRALADADRAVRGAALAALRHDAAANNLLAILARSAALPSDVRANLLDLATERRERKALAVAARAAEDRSVVLRRAALSALGTLGNHDVVPTLARAMCSSDAAEREAATTALIRVRGSLADMAIENSALRADPTLRRMLESVVIARATPGNLSAVWRIAEGKTETRPEAIRAIGQLGEGTDCRRLLSLHGRATDAERGAIAEAVAAICSRTGSVAPVLAAFPTAGAPVQASLCWVLGSVGGAQALATLRAALRSDDPAVRTAAVEALSGWSDAAPLDDLAAIATGGDARIRRLAIRGMIQLAPLVKPGDRAHAVDMLERARAAAEQPEDRKALIFALGSIPCPTALAAAERYTGEPEAAGEAALASLQIADALCWQIPSDAERIARKYEASPNASLQARATNLLIKLAQGENLARGARASNPDGLRPDGEGGGPEAAIDGNPATYWDEEDNKSLYVLRVELKSPATVSALRITGYQHQSYAPKDFEVLCDDRVVKKVENALYQENTLTVALPETRCQTVELRITGYYGSSPAIRELGIYSRLQRSAK